MASNENGVISQIVKNQGAVPVFDRKDPDYARKVSEFATQIASGVAPTGTGTPPAKVEHQTSWRPTTFTEDVLPDPNVDLPVPASTGAVGTKRVVKFTDDIGDDVEQEVDFGSEEGLTALVRGARETENLRQEMAALRDELAGKTAATQSEMAKAKRYLDLEKLGSREAILDELFRDAGGYEGFRKTLIDEQQGYEKMTAEEQRDHDIKRERADSARKLTELEKRLNDKEKAADKKIGDANYAAKVAILNSVYSKFKFENAESDPAITKINQMIFNEAQGNIRTLESQGVTVTENILNREFKKANQLFKGKINIGVKAPKVNVAKELADQADAAMAAAQTLNSQSQNAGGPESDAETIGRWVAMLKEGKAYQVSGEAAKSPKSQNLYARLANMISRDRNLLTGVKPR